jgi:hypothetical protein
LRRRGPAGWGVPPATGSAAAATRSTPSGTTASSAVSTARSSAHAPFQPKVTTRDPTCGPEPSAAAATTTPVASQPGIVPSGRSGVRNATSPKLKENATTSTRACDGPGCGVGALSIRSMCSPARWWTSAFIVGPICRAMGFRGRTLRSATGGRAR